MVGAATVPKKGVVTAAGAEKEVVEREEDAGRRWEHYRRRSSNEPRSPLLRAAVGPRPTSPSAQQRGAVAFRSDQNRRQPKSQEQHRQRWRVQLKGPHTPWDSGDARRCEETSKHFVRASPNAGRHFYGQKPRRKESAPASSHRSSLEEFDLPFQVGECVVDPETRHHYELKKLLGRGAYALVWEAERMTDNTLVALKALSTKSLTPEQRELQRLEAQLHAEAYSHAPSSVVPFLATWLQPDDHWVWICLGNCTNGDLYTWLTDGPGSSSRLGPHLRSKFWLEILAAVQQVHEIGIGHRDLKPENFLISTKNSMMLTDFGLATKESLSTDWECGSRPYMAPEVCEKNRPKPSAEGEDQSLAPSKTLEPYDPRVSDVWSLGIIYLNLHYLCSAWSSPDPSCRTFYHFMQNPDTWLEDAGVENRQTREWLTTKVFVNPSKRCSVSEWLEYEKSRKPLAAARPRSSPSVGTPSNKDAGIAIPRDFAVPTARAPATAAPRPRLAVSAPADTPSKPGGGTTAARFDLSAPSDTPSAAARANGTPRPLPASSRTGVKRGHRRRPSWAYDLDFDSADGKMDYSAPPVFVIEDLSDDETPVKGQSDEDPFVVRAQPQAAEAAEHTKICP